MNIAVIFAGGTGQRMNSRTRPKQFLELHGKPIIIYTIQHFDQHPDIDAIIVVCLWKWSDVLKRLITDYGIKKVKAIVPGGGTGQESIRNGVYEAARRFPEDSIVLIPDGVRPLIDEGTITRCIQCTKENGNAITVVPAIETVVRSKDGIITDFIKRQDCRLARAPQCCRLGDIRDAHQRAEQEGRDDFVDSATLMAHYGHVLHEVEGSTENIKVTTPPDYYIMRAIMDAQEDAQIFGL